MSTKFRYLGEPVNNWYGLNLGTGEVYDLPSHLTHKAKPPRWEPVGEVKPAPEPEMAFFEPPKKRRGRPPKVRHEPS